METADEYVDLLSKLINTLKEDEVKSFNKILLQNKANEYFKIFNKIVDGVGDKNKLTVSQNEKVIRGILKEKLLNFLSDKEKESSLRYLMNLVFQVEVLYNRNLFQEAWKLSSIVIEKAQQHDLKWVIFEISKWRYFIAHQIFKENYAEEINKIKSFNNENFEKINLNIDIGGIQEEFLSLMNSNLNLRNENYLNEINKIKQNSLLSIDDFDNRLLYYSKLQLYYTKGGIALLEGEFETGLKYMLMTWNIYESDMDFYLKYKKSDIIISMYNVLNALNANTKLSLHEEFIEKFTIIIYDKFKDNQIIIPLLNYSKLYFLVKSKKITLFDLETNKSFIEINKCYLNFQTYKLNVILLAYSYYLLKEYKQAKLLLNDIVYVNKKKDLRFDLVMEAEMLYLLIDFEYILISKNTTKQINNFISNVKVLYDKIRRMPKDDNYSLELILIKLYKSIKHNYSNKNIVKAIIVARNKLNDLYKNPYPYLKINNLINHNELFNKWIQTLEN